MGVLSGVLSGVLISGVLTSGVLTSGVLTSGVLVLGDLFSDLVLSSPQPMNNPRLRITHRAARRFIRELQSKGLIPEGTARSNEPVKRMGMVRGWRRGAMPRPVEAKRVLDGTLFR